MNKRIPTLFVLMALATTSFLSCSKIIDWKNITHNPKGNGCDVAEYHLPYYDDYSIPFPFLFKKKYDPSGKIVKEIDCSFWNISSPARLAHLELTLVRKERNLLFLDKYNQFDTVMSAYLNNYGRVESLIGSDKLINYEEKIRSNKFFYANNRLTAVETIITDADGNKTSQLNSVSYDSYGNILSFRNNTYQYDYNRKANQQFYVDDYMDYDNGYYLLQYLGYFPEVTNPLNIRVRVETTVFKENLINHSFDADNRLTSYQFGNLGKATILYHCK
ncbi:MAG: hypothetical protein WKF97_14135 [Chitinophagaceae bacterium]